MKHDSRSSNKVNDDIYTAIDDFDEFRACWAERYETDASSAWSKKKKKHNNNKNKKKTQLLGRRRRTRRRQLLIILGSTRSIRIRRSRLIRIVRDA